MAFPSVNIEGNPLDLLMDFRILACDAEEAIEPGRANASKNYTFELPIYVEMLHRRYNN